MRALVFAFLVFWNFSVWAQGPQPPLQLCEQTGKCSKAQWEISKKFFSSPGLDKEWIGEVVYSGVCYHSGRGWDSAKAHHGVTFFDYKEGAAYFGGQFSFFKPENPYLDWTPERARQELTKIFEKNHRVTLTPEYATAVFEERDPVWIYWFTQDELTKHVYLQALWSRDYFLWCDLKPNPSR